MRIRPRSGDVRFAVGLVVVLTLAVILIDDNAIAETTSYEYDVMNRLQSATSSNQTVDYRYDAHGNMIAVISTVANNHPTDLQLSESTVLESQSRNAAIGIFSSTDPDSGNAFTFELASGVGSTDNALFAIVGNELRLKTGISFEEKDTLTIRIRCTDQGGLSTEKVLIITVMPHSSYALWSRGDTGKAVLWKFDPKSGGISSYGWLFSAAGVGAPWLATSYKQVSDTKGYVLWTRSDTGQAALWEVNPSDMDMNTISPVVKGSHIYSKSGIGNPWQASDYEQVSDTKGYVLWTRSDKGAAALWEIDPSVIGAVEALPIVNASYLLRASGIGGPWEASSYRQVSETEGYVLWTRSDTGQAALWKIDPRMIGQVSTIPVEQGSFLYSSAGIGSPWQASSYDQASGTHGYVLWTNADKGKAAVWQIDPSMIGTMKSIPVNSGFYIYSSQGVGGPWQATGYDHNGLGETVSINAPDPPQAGMPPIEFIPGMMDE